jgi:hypothetical protein
VSDLEDRFLLATERLMRDPQPVRVELSKFELWSLLACVQLACRHPAFIGRSRHREFVESLARRIGGDLTANDPDLRLCFAAGWEKIFDGPRGSQ